MGKIVILDENTSNKIAAGEVVERPASVIKELVENSIDAGAGSITVEIKNGGISFIKVSDNGSGIDEDDAEIAFERHATSKIRNSNDLDAISTLGFRGEALASIAAVSAVELTTRVQKNTHGTFIRIQGGVTKEVKQTGGPVGTTFVIRDLFYNTPARYKFLKKDSTEAGYISDIISRLALGNPQISFRLISNSTNVIHTPGNNDLLSAIFSVYGKDTAKFVNEINYSDSKVKITGYAGKPEIARSNRNHQSVFINGRYVRSKVITSAIDEAYNTFLMKNKYAFIVLKIEVNPMLVDVNVHPTKMEVRFSEEQEIFRSVYHAIYNALLNAPLIRETNFGSKNTFHDTDKRETFKFEKSGFGKKVDYKQQNIEKVFPVVKETSNTDYGRKETISPQNSVQSTVINKHESKNTEIEPSKESYTPGKKDVDITGKTNQVADRLINKEEVTIPVIKKSTEDLFSNVKIVGQAFSTYIILQQEEDLLLIDQHAAHERIMYEKLKRKFENNESMEQMLLAPVVVELTYQELKLLEAERDFFARLGFNYEDFGNNSVIIRSVPFSGDSTMIKELFLELVDKMVSKVKSEYASEADETLYDIACKAAIKANKGLGEIEIQSILKGLSEIENPYTCPHGRPTIIKMSKYELEKKFKRIV